MSSWSTRRRTAYLSVFMGIILILVGVPAYFLLNEEPTCFDGVQNGSETGVDCGGSCELVCSFEASRPIIHWNQSFEVRDGVWSVAAYIENPNSAFAKNVPYTFSLLDSRGVLVAEKEGTAYIPPRQTFVVFEPAVDVGNRVPSREFFEFNTEEIAWKKFEGQKPRLEVGNISLSGRRDSTRLSADIRNLGTIAVENIEVYGILYDIEGNAVATSRTFIDSIAPEDTRGAVFTWPQVLADVVTKREVIHTVVPE